MLCSELQLVKRVENRDAIKPLPCKRWSCEWCSEPRRRALMALAASGEPNKILTLTVNPAHGMSPTHRRDMLHDAWKRLVKRAIRAFGWPKIHYMAFLERTKQGEPHLHILLRCGFIPQRWLSAQMAQMIGAPIVWIEKINGTRQAVRYVTKYVTKEPAQFGKGKRYWVSREWEINKPEPVEEADRKPRDYSIQRCKWADELQRRVFHHECWVDIGDGWLQFYKRWEYVGNPGLMSDERYLWKLEK